jgi:hypothetical protein
MFVPQLGDITVKRGASSPRIQAFSVTISGAKTGVATISSVDMSRSIILLNGGIIGGADSSFPFYAELTNATTVTVTRTASSGTSVTVKGCVIEFPVGVIKTLQRGVISMTNAQTTKSTTVSAVNTTKSALSHLGQITDLTNTGAGTTNALASSNAHIALTSATNIDAARQTVSSSGGTPGNNTCAISYELIEFY